MAFESQLRWRAEARCVPLPLPVPAVPTRTASEGQIRRVGFSPPIAYMRASSIPRQPASPSKRRLFLKRSRRACLELLLCGAVCCGIFALTGLPWSSKLPEANSEEESRRRTVSQSGSTVAASQLLERRRQQRARSNTTVIAENLAAAASGFNAGAAATASEPLSIPTTRRAASEQPVSQAHATPQTNHDASSQHESIRCVLLGSSGAPAELPHSRIEDDYCDCEARSQDCSQTSALALTQRADAPR